MYEFSLSSCVLNNSRSKFMSILTYIGLYRFMVDMKWLHILTAQKHFLQSRLFTLIKQPYSETCAMERALPYLFQHRAFNNVFRCFPKWASYVLQGFRVFKKKPLTFYRFRISQSPRGSVKERTNNNSFDTKVQSTFIYLAKIYIIYIFIYLKNLH